MCRRHFIVNKETNHITFFLFTVLKYFVSILQSPQCLCLPFFNKMNRILLLTIESGRMANRSIHHNINTDTTVSSTPYLSKPRLVCTN